MNQGSSCDTTMAVHAIPTARTACKSVVGGDPSPLKSVLQSCARRWLAGHARGRLELLRGFGECRRASVFEEVRVVRDDAIRSPGLAVSQDLFAADRDAVRTVNSGYVGAWAARHNIHFAVAEGSEFVVTGPALKDVMAWASFEPVAAGPPSHAVITVSPEEPVVAVIAVERVVPVASLLRVGPAATELAVIAKAADKEVVPGAADDEVVSALAPEVVVAGKAVNLIVAETAEDAVASRGALENVVARSAAEIQRRRGEWKSHEETAREKGSDVSSVHRLLRSESVGFTAR